MSNSIKTLTDSELIDLIRSETKYKIKAYSNLSALLNEAADRLEQKLKGGAE